MGKPRHRASLCGAQSRVSRLLTPVCDLTLLRWPFPSYDPSAIPSSLAQLCDSQPAQTLVSLGLPPRRLFFPLPFLEVSYFLSKTLLSSRFLQKAQERSSQVLPLPHLCHLELPSQAHKQKCLVGTVCCFQCRALSSEKQAAVP